MANEKISQMTYKQLAEDDYVPAVNPVTNPLENYYFLGADIPLLVGVSQWDAAATYAAGHIVIYNTSTVKGMFLVTTTTSAGDAPDGAGATKFKTLSLCFVNNEFNCVSNVWTITHQLTGRLIFENGTSFSGSPDVLTFTLETSIDDTQLTNASLSFKFNSPGQALIFSVRSVTKGAAPSTLAIALECWGTGINTLNGKYIDYEIKL